MMKHLLGIVFVVSCLLVVTGSAQSDSPTSAWTVALYDANAQMVVLIRPNQVETLAAPACLVTDTDPNYYFNWFSHLAALSPDYRFLAVDTERFPGILVADLEKETCFEVQIDETYTGYVDVGVFNPESTQLAFSWGPPGRILLVDLIETPGTILQTLDFDMRTNPLLEHWDANGIDFFTTCYECGPGKSGLLKRWDPTSGMITETEELFTRIVGDTLGLTGETVTMTQNEDYPDTGYQFALNVIEYASGEPGAAGQVVYYDASYPDLSEWPQPLWVLDGNAFFIRQTVVFRDGHTLPVTENSCLNVIAGTPDGWLAQDEQTIAYCQIVDGEVISTHVDGTVAGPTLLLRQSPLGETVSEAITPQPFADTFRLSYCGTLTGAPQLGRERPGHVITAEALPLYTEPDTNSEVVTTFTDFEVVNGPFCANPDTIWWLLTTDDQMGWALERSGGGQLLELDCVAADAPGWFQNSTEVKYDGELLFEANTHLYGIPIDYRVDLGKVESGETLTLVDGPLCSHKQYWWLVAYQDKTGWIMEP